MVKQVASGEVGGKNLLLSRKGLTWRERAEKGGLNRQVKTLGAQVTLNLNH